MSFPFLQKNSLTVLLNKIEKYSAFKGEWSYKIPRDFIDAVLSNEDVNERGERLISDVCKASFKNNIVDRLRNDTLTVEWKPTDKIPFGRRYSGGFKDFVSTANFGVQARSIKNSFFEREGWVDFDLVKCHSQLICELIRVSGKNIDCRIIEQYIKDFDTVSKDLIKVFSADTQNPLNSDDIKGLFNLTIYGGGFDTWKKWVETDDPKKNYTGKPVANVINPFFQAFSRCVHSFRDAIIADNKELLGVVIQAKPLRYDETKKRMETPEEASSRQERSLLSFWLQIFENHCLYLGYKTMVDNKWIEARKADLCYDGFTAKLLPGCPEMSVILQTINDEIIKKTGIKMTFTNKSFKDTVPSIVKLPRKEVDEKQTYDLYCHPDYLRHKENLDKNYALIRSSANYIYHNVENGAKTIRFHSEKEIITVNRHLQYVVVDDKGKKIHRPVINEWLNDPSKPYYERLECVPPPHVCPDNVFNTWMGSIYDDFPFIESEDGEADPEYDADAVEKFVYHIQNVICSGDESLSRYVMTYFAHMIQKPAEKPGAMLVLTGTEGSGKSSLTEIFKKMYPQGMVFTTASPEKYVWGHFNEPMANVLLLGLEEVDKRNTKDADGKIKDLITNPIITINKKGIQSYEQNSFLRTILTTNNLDPLTFSKNDRRLCIIRVSDCKVGDKEYFNAMWKAFERPHAMRSIYWALKTTWDITQLDVSKPPMTEYKQDLIETHKSPIDLWLQSYVMENFNEYKNSTIEVGGVALLDSFKEFCRENGYDKYSDMNCGNLIKHLKLGMGLPQDAIIAGKRTKKGYKQHISIPILASHYNISAVCMVNGVAEER